MLQLIQALRTPLTIDDRRGMLCCEVFSCTICAALFARRLVPSNTIPATSSAAESRAYLTMQWPCRTPAPLQTVPQSRQTKSPRPPLLRPWLSLRYVHWCPGSVRCMSSQL